MALFNRSKRRLGFLNVQLSQKMIMDRCGSVSLKRGEAFYKSDKVQFEYYNENSCGAIVQGTEDFLVKIETTGKNDLQAHCTCPKLASFQKDCQHIAAVLISCWHLQQKGETPIVFKREEKDLSESFFALFDDRKIPSSKKQRHFENREVVPVKFVLKLEDMGQSQKIFGIELFIAENKVKDVRFFLSNLRNAKAYKLSKELTFDPKIHCFSEEIDACLQELNRMKEDEFLLTDSQALQIEKDTLFIPPSSWHSLCPLLENISISYKDSKDSTEEIKAFRFSDELLPLTFFFHLSKTGTHQLQITGMDQIILLQPYHAVFYNGIYTSLLPSDFSRIVELKKMVDTLGKNIIPIAAEQVDFFVEKVAPSLKRVGKVQLEEDLSKQIKQIPLHAELYLDRVNNRLLASLEFKYDYVSFNPVEEEVEVSLVNRDMAKEKAILDLMEASSFARTESGYILYNEELEYEFLVNMLPKLQKLVKVYATTAIRNRIFKEKTWPRFTVKVKKERMNWLEFKFEMEGFPEREIKGLLSALEEKKKYYRLQNGSLFSLQTREMEEIQRFLLSPEIKNKDFVSGFELSILESLSIIDSEKSIFQLEESYRELMDAFLHPEKLEMVVPKELQSILKNYQIEGFKWLKMLAQFGFGGILADDMGLGKTIQSIAFILSELKEMRKGKEKVLVICPSSLTYNWQSEIMKFAPNIQSIVMDGSVKERSQLQKEITDVDVIITSYPLLKRDIQWYEEQTFRTIFFDEAQYFKNPFTQTAKAVKRLKANNRFALTGTPMENTIEELWSIFHIVFPELFKGIKEFANLTNKQIARRINPFMLRRLKEDVLEELPGKNQWNELVELTSDQKTLYTAYLAKLRHKTLKHLDKDTLRKNKIRILAGLTRLRQICCHPSLFVENYKGKSAKLEQLLAIVEEARNSDRRVLIFSQFTSMLDIIGSEFVKKGISFFYLDGNTPSDKRVELCHRYNLGERDFFLISLKAGGTGLNLMTADTVILFDTWWNPAVEEQATDRAHRIGQKKEVHVIKLVTKGTIEEKMNDLQEKKKRLVDEIIDSEENMITSLTEEDLRLLLSE